MEPLALTIIIVLLAVIMVVIYMLVDCCSGHYINDYSSNSNNSLVDESSINSSDKSSLPISIVVEKDSHSSNTKSSQGITNPALDIITHIHQGSKSLHARGLCNVGFGAWGTVTSPTGRPACKNTWTPVSGGPFDSCQCEDNGGLH